MFTRIAGCFALLLAALTFTYSSPAHAVTGYASDGVVMVKSAYAPDPSHPSLAVIESTTMAAILNWASRSAIP